MSRYTADEIKSLSKAVLIGYVKRQPKISFPTKICSRSLENMDKKHLIRGLTGNYGYVRASILPSATLCAVRMGNPIDVVQPEVCYDGHVPNDGYESEGIHDDDHASLSPICERPDGGEDEVCSALISSVQSVCLTAPAANLSLEGVKANDGENVRQDLMQVDELGHEADLIGPPAVEDSTAADALVVSTLPVPYSSLSLQDDSMNVSSAAQDSVDQTTLAMSALPALYPSSLPQAEHLIAWYGVDERSDKDLLDAYFRENQTLAEQISHMKSHKRKRQTDVGLVRDYKFGLEVYKLLMGRKWENESGHILSESIMKHIGLSAPWFTRARKVIALLEKIGPGSPNQDPLVLQRFSSAATIHKGEDILNFLKARANAIGIQ